MRVIAESRIRPKKAVAGIYQYECPCCRHVLPGDMIVDCSSAPDELTGGAKWACTGCIDGWYRQRKTIGGKAVSRADIEVALGGPEPDRADPYWGKTSMTSRILKEK